MSPDLTEQIMVRVSPDTLDQLKAISAQEERTVAQTVRLAIREHLADWRASRAEQKPER